MLYNLNALYRDGGIEFYFSVCLSEHLPIRLHWHYQPIFQELVN